MSERSLQLQQNVRAIEDRIAAAATRARRQPEDVTLVAVSKYVDADVIRDLVTTGCHVLGESRPQVLWPKAELLADLTEIRWHQIGHLQRNKLKRTLPLVSLVHSVDSLRLLKAIDDLRAEWIREHPSSEPMDVLLEINTSGDDAKHGFTVAGCREGIEAAMAMKCVRLRGLMCMAGLRTNHAGAQHDFASLRELRDTLQTEYPTANLSELSMGMSGDFEAAIEEGSTLVRVGSALFEGIG